MSDFSNDPIEFARCWSSVAGQLAGLKLVLVQIENKAAECFVRGQDQTAQTVRDLARKVEFMVREAAGRVEDYIKESRRREAEIRKVLGH